MGYCPCCGQLCCCSSCCMPCCNTFAPYWPCVTSTSSYIGHMIGLVFAFLHTTNVAYPLFSLIFYVIHMIMQICTVRDCLKVSFVYLLSLFLLVLSFTTSLAFIAVGSTILGSICCVEFGHLLANF